MSKLLLLVLIGASMSNTYTGINLFLLGQVVEIENIDTGGFPVAFVDNVRIGANIEFLDLPMDIQEVSIAHELGHIEYNHINTYGWIERDAYLYIFKTADPREVDADLFAARLMGRARVIDFLTYYINICRNMKRDRCLEEANYRRYMIESRMCI